MIYADAIVDLQFGSTGKGVLAYALAMAGEYDTAVCAFSPNAGHTSESRLSGPFVVRALPSALLWPAVERGFIGPGAVLDIDNLRKDCATIFEARGLRAPRIYVHEAAGVVSPRHREEEAQRLGAISSTMKGSSGPYLDKALRVAERGPGLFAAHHAAELADLGVEVLRNHEYIHALNQSQRVLVEGCQGYSLSPTAGFWPYCTYRECTVGQLLADTLVAPLDLRHVWGCARTFPIRVGSLPGTTSGACYLDQIETTWEAVGQEPEYTTVTKRQRRVFTFSHDQLRAACDANGVTHLFMNFMNYLGPDAHAAFVPALYGTLANLERVPSVLFGHGRYSDDLVHQLGAIT